MNWWTESGIAGKECSGKEGEASRLKSTPIDAPLSEVERYHAMALRNEFGRGRVALARPAGPTL